MAKNKIILKRWPKDNKPARFSEIADGVADLMESVITDIKNYGEPKSFSYHGYDIGNPLKANVLSIRNTLSLDGIKCNKEQGRDIIRVLTSFIIQLGIEQGRRLELEKQSESWNLVLLEVNMLKYMINNNYKKC